MMNIPKKRPCGFLGLLSMIGLCGWLQAAEAATGGGGASLRFIADGRGFRFDTGRLSGLLHAQGRSQGLSDVAVAGVPGVISSSMGLFSHYRLLDDKARYGGGAWDWESEATVTADGAVDVRWKEDGSRPFDLRAIYSWVAPDTLDLVTRVTARRDVGRLEVFLASYFKGFDRAFVLGKGEAGPTFVEALERDASWHMFPRGRDVIPVIQDGRWLREPNPVNWTMRDPFAAPLAMRVDAGVDLTAVVFGDPDNCFAVATPHGAEPHRSLYLSLFGCDLKAGEVAEARTRLVVARGLVQGQVLERWREFAGDLRAKKGL